MKIVIILVNVLITLTNYANSQHFVTESLSNNVHFTVNPDYLVEGVATQVDCVCTFKRANVPSMASVLSIVLGYSNKTDHPLFDSLALVNEIDGKAHNLTHIIEVISGSIDNNGESILHMRFSYPETQLIGLHMCEITGFDQIGKPVSIYSTANVVATNITELVSTLLNAQSNISELVDAIHIAQSNKTDLVDTLHVVNSNISALEVVVNRAQECIDIQSNYTETMLNLQTTVCLDYFPPAFYNGHIYYLSHLLTYFKYKEMQSRCEALDGYLVEVDTHGEFSFLKDYIMKHLRYGDVYTGATDEEHEGVWINKHNPTNTPYIQWGTGHTSRGREYNCLCFDSSYSWLFDDCNCNNTFRDFSHMCEIPIQIC